MRQPESVPNKEGRPALTLGFCTGFTCSWQWLVTEKSPEQEELSTKRCKQALKKVPAAYLLVPLRNQTDV